MDKRMLNGLIINQRKQSEYGKKRFDPALANLLFKPQSEVDADLATALEMFVSSRKRQPTDEELAAVYVLLEEKRSKLKDIELEAYMKKNEKELEIDSERDKEQNQDLNNQLQQEAQEQNDDLFLLDRVGNNFRLQVRDGIDERNREDRQRAMMERSLRIIAALEKIKDAVKQDNGMIELSADMFKGLEPKEVEQQMGLLKAMGVQDVGENKGVISLATMRDDTWGENIADMKKWLEDRGITLDGKAPVTVKGLDEVTRQEQTANQRRVEDNEMTM